MRISGITIPNKRLPYALATLYGVGIPLGRTICEKANVDSTKRADDLSAEEENAIRAQLVSLKLFRDVDCAAGCSAAGCATDDQAIADSLAAADSGDSL